MSGITIEVITPKTLSLLDSALRSLSHMLDDQHQATIETLGAGLFGDQPACHGLIAIEEGALEPKGCCLFSPAFSTNGSGAGLYVSDLWVSESERGKGLGKQLLQAAMRHAGEMWNAKYMRLVAYDESVAAIDFYLNNGFARVGGETSLQLTGKQYENFAA